MNFEYEIIKQFVVPLSAAAGGIFLGFIFERFILVKIGKVTLKTKWKADEVIIGSFHNLITLWFVIAGISIALNAIQLGPVPAHYIRKILLLIVILSVTVLIARILVGLIRAYSESMSDGLPSATIIINFTRLVVYMIGLLIMLQSVGISITPILTALGVGGLAVALALRDTLSNLFSGLQIIISRQKIT